MNETDMIKNLQERFGLSEIQANVIYFQLQEHFANEAKTTRTRSHKSMEVT